MSRLGSPPRRVRRCVWAGGLLGVVLLAPATASGLDPVPIVTAPGYQDLTNQPGISSLLADPSGGYYLAWEDGASGIAHIVVQGLGDDLAPRAAWPADGRRFQSEQWVILGGLVPDGRGGALAWWTRDGGRLTIAQMRHDGSPQPGWPMKGVTFGSEAAVVEMAAIEPDHSGGAWVMFRRPLSDDASEMRVTRIQDNGAFPAFYGELGLRLTDRAPRYSFPMVIGDGQGGALVRWVARDPSGVAELRLLRLAPAGVAPGWPIDGVVVRSSPDIVADWGDETPLIAADGGGGAFVAWSEKVPTASSDQNVRLSHVTGAGQIAPGWPGDGMKLADSDWQEGLSGLVGDEGGGVFAAWRVGYIDVRVQHVLGDGSLAAGRWQPGGVSPAAGGTAGAPALLASDRSGGLYLTWPRMYGEGGAGLGRALRLQRMTGAGEPHSGWPPEGRSLWTPEHALARKALAVGAPDQAVVVWSEYLLPGTSAESDLLGLLIGPQPNPPEVPAWSLDFGRPRPNPTPGPMTVELELPASTAVKVWIADLAGREVRTLVGGSRGPGIERIAWDGRDQAGHLVCQGIYFVVREAMGRRRADRFVVAR